MLKRKGVPRDGDEPPSSSTVRLRTAAETEEQRDKRRPYLEDKKGIPVHYLEQVQAIKEGKCAAKKKERAEQRRILHGDNPGLQPMSAATFLEEKSVGKARKDSYLKSWNQLVAWAREKSLKMETINHLDHVVTTNMNYMFFNGDTLADAMTLLAATKFFRRDIQKTTQLARATCALAGYRKLDPPQGRLPVYLG